jgi:hypothetical protein
MVAISLERDKHKKVKKIELKRATLLKKQSQLSSSRCALKLKDTIKFNIRDSAKKVLDKLQQKVSEHADPKDVVLIRLPKTLKRQTKRIVLSLLKERFPNAICLTSAEIKERIERSKQNQQRLYNLLSSEKLPCVNRDKQQNSV